MLKEKPSFQTIDRYGTLKVGSRGGSLVEESSGFRTETLGCVLQCVK